MLSDGPEVSLKGSPTVSPTTAALWGSEPLPPWAPPSMYFLALSHAPPAFAMKSAIRTPVTVAPASSPPRASTPRKRPTTTGASTAVTPGRSISRKAARVEMSTQRAESGLAEPSISPGISRNWRRTSSTIPAAARPTAVMVKAATRKGSIPPMKRPTTTSGLVRSIPAACRPTLEA